VEAESVRKQSYPMFAGVAFELLATFQKIYIKLVKIKLTSDLSSKPLIFDFRQQTSYNERN